MKKSVAMFLCAVVTVSSLSVAAIAAEGITANQAKIIAEKQVPPASKYLKTEMDEGKYEVLFSHAGNKERYEIEISVSTGKILSYESKRIDKRGGSTVIVTEDAAKKKVTGEIPKAEILSTHLDSDDGYQAYEVRFRTDSYYGEYTIHPENETILERDVRVGTMPSSSKENTNLISREKAVELALKEVPGSVMTDFDLDYENNYYVYEIELYHNGNEYDITLDAKTGNVSKNRFHTEEWDPEWFSPQSTGNYISVEQARQIALGRVPGATVKECKLDYEDGRAVYEGELRKDNQEYEFEMDAVTGEFMKWEMDDDD